MTTKITYGLTSSVEKEFDPSVTIEALLADECLMANLGAPQGCVATYKGVAIPANQPVSRYAKIELEKRAASKA